MYDSIRRISVMNYTKIISVTLDHMTESFSKSYSVNALYRIASEIVTDKISSDGNLFDFAVLIEWMENEKNTWYNGKYKAIKRFIYLMNDYIVNGCFTDRFTYHNSSCIYQILNQDFAEIVNRFIDYKSSDVEASIDVYRTQSSHLLLYLQNHMLQIEDISYEVLYDFREYVYSEQTKKNAQRTIEYARQMLDFMFMVGIVHKSDYSFVLYKPVWPYFLEIRNQYISDEYSDIGINFDLNDFIIQPFVDLYVNRNYAKKETSKILFAISVYHTFLDYHDLHASMETVLFFISQIVQNLTAGYKEWRTILLRFIDYLNQNEVIFNRSYSFTTLKYDSMPFWAKDVAERYIEYRTRLGMKKSTITTDRNSIVRFVEYLDTIGFTSFDGLSAQYVYDFLEQDEHSTASGKSCYKAHILGFLRFLKDEKTIDFYISPNVVSYRIPQKIVTTLPSDTVNIIFESRDFFSSIIELRDYAIVMIGLRLGLRKSEIVNIRFQDIDLKNRTLTITQTKTQKEIIYPLPVIVGNCIFEYVRKRKPESNQEFLFVTKTAPYNKATSSVCSRALVRVLKKLNIQFEPHGFHILRRTYASTLLNKGEAISSVADALGHSDNSTLNVYLSLSVEIMQKCPLSLDKVPYGGTRL